MQCRFCPPAKKTPPLPPQRSRSPKFPSPVQIKAKAIAPPPMGGAWKAWEPAETRSAVTAPPDRDRILDRLRARATISRQRRSLTSWQSVKRSDEPPLRAAGELEGSGCAPLDRDYGARGERLRSPRPRPVPSSRGAATLPSTKTSTELEGSDCAPPSTETSTEQPARRRLRRSDGSRQRRARHPREGRSRIAHRRIPHGVRQSEVGPQTREGREQVPRVNLPAVRLLNGLGRKRRIFHDTVLRLRRLTCASGVDVVVPGPRRVEPDAQGKRGEKRHVVLGVESQRDTIDGGWSRTTRAGVARVPVDVILVVRSQIEVECSEPAVDLGHDSRSRDEPRKLTVIRRRCRQPEAQRSTAQGESSSAAQRGACTSRSCRRRGSPLSPWSPRNRW